MRNVTNCERVKRERGETEETYRMKVLLCKLGNKLGFEVDIEEGQESELGKLAIRHDVLWYAKSPEWFRKLLEIVLSRGDTDSGYRKLVNSKFGLKRHLCAAFEIEATDVMTKAMKGDISNLSKLPYGIVLVRRGRGKARVDVGTKSKKVEPIRNRFEKALIEFRSLHGPNNVVVVSFEDIEKLCKLYEISYS